MNSSGQTGWQDTWNSNEKGKVGISDFKNKNVIKH